MVLLKEKLVEIDLIMENIALEKEAADERLQKLNEEEEKIKSYGSRLGSSNIYSKELIGDTGYEVQQVFKDSLNRFILGSGCDQELFDENYKFKSRISGDDYVCGLAYKKFNYFGGLSGIIIVDQGSFEEVKQQK